MVYYLPQLINNVDEFILCYCSLRDIDLFLKIHVVFLSLSLALTLFILFFDRAIGDGVGEESEDLRDREGV